MLVAVDAGETAAPEIDHVVYDVPDGEANALRSLLDQRGDGRSSSSAGPSRGQEARQAPGRAGLSVGSSRKFAMSITGNCAPPRETARTCSSTGATRLGLVPGPPGRRRSR